MSAAVYKKLKALSLDEIKKFALLELALWKGMISGIDPQYLQE
jgi:hypothetical protein